MAEKKATKAAKKTTAAKPKKEAKTASKSTGETLNKKGIDALSGLLDNINKTNDVAVFKIASEDTLNSDVKCWFPTGCPTLDLACGGGFPSGRITEIFGTRSSGKSTIVQHALVECQRMGGIAVYVDTENSLHRDRFKYFGVDEKSLVHLEPKYLEDGIEMLFKFVKKVKETAELKSRPILIIWDTIVYTPSRMEVAEKGDKGYEEGAVKSELMLKNKRNSKVRGYMSHIIDLIAENSVAFVVVNHVTEAIGAMYRGAYAKPGGSAMDYGASLQILVKPNNGLKIMEGEGDQERQVGCGVTFRIEKTRLSVPKAQVSARLNWFKGIDVPMTVLDHLKERGLTTREGNRYRVPSPESVGELTISSGPAGEEAFRTAWEESPELQKYLLALMEEDYNSIVPWRQPEVEKAPEEEPKEKPQLSYDIFT
jgi:recombination protein RecA